MDPVDHPFVLKRLTEDELREFVDGFIDGRIFAAAHLPPRERIRLMPVVFAPIMLGVLDRMPPDVLDQLGMVWEWTDKAINPVTIKSDRHTILPDHSVINMMRTLCAQKKVPHFSSMRVMHADDWALAVKAIRERTRHPIVTHTTND